MLFATKLGERRKVTLIKVLILSVLLIIGVPMFLGIVAFFCVKLGTIAFYIGRKKGQKLTEEDDSGG